MTGIELSDGSCASVVDSSPLSFVVLRPGDTLEKNVCFGCLLSVEMPPLQMCLMQEL